MYNIDSHNHVTGKSVYLDDIPVLKGTLYAVIFSSPIAHGRITRLDTSKALLLDGIEKIITYKDITGINQIGGIIPDEPLLAQDELHYQGQPIALIVGQDELIIRKALKFIDLKYDEFDAVIDPRVAKEQGKLLIPSRTFSMGDIEKVRSQCDYIFEGSVESGGQEHLYLETQGAYAFPMDGGVIKVFSSTQGPTAVQKTIAMVTGIPMNQIEVDVTRLGGGFGGKEDQASGFAAMVALASYLIQKPVKISLHRLDDIKVTGKRHPYSSDFTIGLTKDLKIQFLKATMYQNGGAAADLSPAIMERTLFHSTNAYYIPNTEITVYSCKTNLPPNTAFRGFGAPQGMFVIESAIRKAAFELNLPAYIIQERNFIGENNEFQYGQIAKSVNIGACYNKLRNDFDIAKILSNIETYNITNKLIKQGFAIMPICFGISFTNTSMNQARALVHIYQDGSIGVSTGAIEMGQGVNTKLAQIAAKVFSIDLDRIKILTTNTSRVANTSPTAASSGADLNGNAVLVACNELLIRLKKHASKILGADYDRIIIKDEYVYVNEKITDITWLKLIQSAFLDRVCLTENGHYSTPAIYFDKKKEKGHPFAYHVYGAALVTASVDCLRGTYEINDVRIVHDFGNSINLEIDLGQVEGALVQGIGWMTLEELAFNSFGKLLSNSLSTYKIPDIYSSPKIVECVPLDLDGPELAIFKSKAVGEPPFMYGIGAYFAIQNAICAFNPKYRVDFNAPLTPEKVLMRLYS